MATFTFISDAIIRALAGFRAPLLWRLFRDNDLAICEVPLGFLMSEFSSDAVVYTKVWDGPKFRIPNNIKTFRILGQMKSENAALTAKAKLCLYVTGNNFSDEQTTASTAYVDKTWTWSDISSLIGQTAQLQLWLQGDGTYKSYAKSDRNGACRFGRS